MHTKMSSRKQKYFSSFKIDDADGKFSVKYIYLQLPPVPFPKNGEGEHNTFKQGLQFYFNKNIYCNVTLLFSVLQNAYQ